MYRLAQAYARLLAFAYYAPRFHGRVPEAGPALVAVNHRNGLADAALQFSMTDRPLRPLVKFKILQMPFVGTLARWVGAIPVYRKKDRVDTALNVDSFEAVRVALESGELILIYPEGESSDATHVRSAKTGAARMALAAGAGAEAGDTARVAILPVGMVYEDRDGWRSIVHVCIGEPRSGADLLGQRTAPSPDASPDAPQDAVQALTHRIEDWLREVSVDCPDPERYRALIGLARHCPGEARDLPSRARELARHLQELDAHEPPAAAALQAQGLVLERVSAAPEPAPGVKLLCAGLAPLALAGLVFYGPSVLLSRWVARHGPPPDKRVTVYMLAVSLATPLWSAGLALAVGLAFGLAAALWIIAGGLLAGWVLLGLQEVRLRLRGRGPEFAAALAAAQHALRDVSLAGPR